MEVATIDNCPVCFMSLEASDAQRNSCDNCDLIPSDAHKIRLNLKLRLNSCELKQYLYTEGYRLELFLKEEKKHFVTVVFANNLLYNAVKDLRVGDSYFVVGWVSKHSNLIDIVDVY